MQHQKTKFTYSKAMFDSKPDAWQLQRVEAYVTEELTISEIADKIGEGRAWRCGNFKPNAKSVSKNNMESCNVIALDFDSVMHEPGEVTDYASTLGMTPNIWYFSYSQGVKPNNNYRVVWVLEEPIQPRQYENAYKTLLQVYKKFDPDPATKDASRMWYGTVHECAVINDTPTPVAVFGAMAAIGKIENGAIPKDAIRSKDDLADKYNDYTMPEEPTYVTTNWYMRLAGRCKSWDMWRSGEYLSYNQRLALFSNLKHLAYKSGKYSIVQDVLQFYDEETYRGHSCTPEQVRNQFRTKLAPLPIVSYDEKYMTVPEFLSLPEIEILNTEVKKDISEVEAAMDESFEKYLVQPGISYIQCQTGLGKTQKFIEFVAKQDLNRVKIVYSAPNYVGMTEFYSRTMAYLKDKGNFRGLEASNQEAEICTFRPPHCMVYSLYNRGAEKGKKRYTKLEASNRKKTYLVEKPKNFKETLPQYPPKPNSKLVFMVPKKQLRSDDEKRLAIGLPCLSKDPDRSHVIRNLMDSDSTGLFIVSHELLLRLPNINASLIVIDENVESSCSSEYFFGEAELSEILRFTSGDTVDDVSHYIKLLKSDVAAYKSVDIKRLKRAVEAMNVDAYLADDKAIIIEGLFNILKADKARIDEITVYVNGEPQIAKRLRIVTGSTIITDSIKNNVPVKLMTATPKPAEIAFTYGLRLKDIPVQKYEQAANKGQVIQYRYHSGAKGNDCERVPDLIETVKRTLPEDIIKSAYVLSFKDSIPMWENAGFKIKYSADDVPIHLANNAGLDLLKGETCIIAGKFDKPDKWYIHKYFDLHPEETEAPKKKNQKIMLNGFMQNLFLFEDEMLRDLQVQNISEFLTQSAGRARVLRELNATVYIFSNFIIGDVDKVFG